MLADAVVELAPAVVGRLELRSPSPSRSSRTEVESVRSAEPATSHGIRAAIAFCTLLDALRVAIPLLVGLEAGDVGVQPSGSSRRCIASSSAACSGCVGAVGLQEALPLGAQLGALLADPSGEALFDPVGDEELGVLRPAVDALGLPHLLLAERFAVGGGGVLLVWRPPPDVAVDDDQRRPVDLGLELVEGASRRNLWATVHPTDASELRPKAWLEAMAPPAPRPFPCSLTAKHRNAGRKGEQNGRLKKANTRTYIESDARCVRAAVSMRGLLARAISMMRRFWIERQIVFSPSCWLRNSRVYTDCWCGR